MVIRRRFNLQKNITRLIIYVKIRIRKSRSKIYDSTRNNVIK